MTCPDCCCDFKDCTCDEVAVAASAPMTIDIQSTECENVEDWDDQETTEMG